MASKTTFELHHNFPKLAEDSGFAFNIHKPRLRVEWNKIRLIDIESLIRDRKFVLIEQYLNDIIGCVLESEFDVRILDEGVIKMFRLAQLTIEYQQFCRHYLDRSVFVLKEELTTIAQELDYAKKTIREKEDEVRKNKRKVKYNYRNQLPYGNDNIANLILQTLANKSDLFPTVAQSEHGHYNKCSYCDKVFMNHLYLKSHLTRRHGNITELPQKDIPAEAKESNENQHDEHSKLHNEIDELKTKLKEMEDYLKLANAQTNPDLNSDVSKLKTQNDVNDVASNSIKTNKNKTTLSPEKPMKDAQVSTNDENYILDKIEEWKKEEYEKYNKEICLLRTQITNIVESHKDATQLKPAPSDNRMMEQLHETIKEQSSEISSLKEELKKLRFKSNEETNIKKEVEEQMAFWVERAEIQSKEYNVLLQKLDNVAKEAQESRQRAEFEKERAMKLQILLEQKINNENPVVNQSSPTNKQNLGHKDESAKISGDKTSKSPKRTNPIPDHQTLEKLQRRAQELLNQSITSSETSSSSDKVDVPNIKKKKPEKNKMNKKMKIKTDSHKVQKNDKSEYIGNGVSQNKTNHSSKLTKNYEPCKNKGTPEKVNEFAHGSPSKIVRAKITEEVNQRLVAIGVDPLKKRLPRDSFQKHRVYLQRSNEIKSKKNADREKVYHSIISYLNNKAIIKKKQIVHEDDYISPSRTPKSFSLTSVISNVKSKALSLVKVNEGIKKEDKSQHDTVTKKALTLLKTPPESPTFSPSKGNKLDRKTASKKKQHNHFEIKTKELKDSKVTNSNRTEKMSETSEDSDTDASEGFQLSNAKSIVEKYVKNQNSRPSPSSATSEITVEKNKNHTETTMNQSKNKIMAFETSNNFTHELNHKLEQDDDIASIQEHDIRYTVSEENINSPKQTKGVLKNASSMSSLYKKKVIFDMDAIQMKSVSASPSQSVTDKSDKNEKYELGIINLDTEEWDISSIENEPIREQKEIKINTRTGPKVAELKKSIESQLTRRSQTMSTALVGGVDVLKGPTLTKTASLGGSNTSLGSSILDDSDSALRTNHTAFVKPKNITENDDSEIDISELIVGDKTRS